LAVFRGGGAKQFFHGGLSPQALLIPVVVVDLLSQIVAPKLKVSVAVAGKRVAHRPRCRPGHHPSRDHKTRVVIDP
jgi:hypothetical protein